MSSRNESSQINQTEFVDEVQFLDSKPPRSFSWRDLRSNRNLRPFYILISLFILLVFFFILRAIFSVPKVEEPEPERMEVQVELGPLNKRVYDLREELKEHNPTKQRLPFPQVDLEFNIN